MENKKYFNPFNNKNGWYYGEKMKGHNEWHSYLGPCPKCGARCFNYGGGWRCLDPNCMYSYTSSFSTFGPEPEWWQDKNIRVFIDGNAFFAVGADFINLQESEFGLGDTPQDAVNNFKSQTNGN